MVGTNSNNGFEAWTLLWDFCQSRVGHWRDSPLKMEHAWSQGWATKCSECLSLGLGETWPPGQRLSSQRRLCAYQHHSSQWPRNLLTMQRRPFSPHATLALNTAGVVDKSFEFYIPDNEGPKTRLGKWGLNLKTYKFSVFPPISMNELPKNHLKIMCESCWFQVLVEQSYHLWYQLIIICTQKTHFVKLWFVWYNATMKPGSLH